MTPTGEKPIPRATYRVQLSAEFGFADAAALVPYLAQLGISHLYLSPYLKARPGSTHGYDLVDHNVLNPELGSAADYDGMVAALRAHGLGHILDFVPNHMGVGGADNPFWLDVLQWGAESRYAGWYDIDWEPEPHHLRGKVLVPFLGDQYGAVLYDGHLALRFDADEGDFAVWAYGVHKLPVSPAHYATILGDSHPVLETLGDAFAHLPGAHVFAHARFAELKRSLGEAARADATVAATIAARVAGFAGRPGEPETWSRLDALIQGQHWRAASFRVASDDINYRRFFNINDLAGVRMEEPEVFEHAHRLVFRLIADGVLDGLRLDHVDGLFDPKAYFLNLREKAPRPFYLVVEKILAPHERLREDWAVDGTTGYEFANLLTGLMVDPEGEAALDEAYAGFAGKMEPFLDVVRESKLLIMEDEMASELRVLARGAGRIARSHPLTSDFTNNVLHRALKQIIASFPVYRTYVDTAGASEVDRRYIDWAVGQARRLEPMVDPTVFDFLHRLLTTDLVAEPRSGYSRHAVVRAAMRAQQYSGPVMAKGLEDTAFYRYNRLLALNEVGGSPDRFGASVASFHGVNIDRARHTPHALLSTSTHDTKRGEDARARLVVLSEVPEAWAARVVAWSRMIRARHGSAADDIPPDRNDEYAFYQLLFAAWPPEFAASADEALDPALLDALRLRIEGAMLKSMREAKLRTSWTAPDLAYEQATMDFIRHALDGSRANPFLSGFNEWARETLPLGVSNSLVQTVLKLAAPGVPDVYQGAELWDLSLVDPDNRRPVDFDLRSRMLAELGGAIGVEELAAMLGRWHDGHIKLHVIATLLRLRRKHPELFGEGAYVPLATAGADAERVCAFARLRDGVTLVVAALLFPGRGAVAADTIVEFPEQARPPSWHSALDGRALPGDGERILAADLFAGLPVAVLHAEPASLS